MLEESKPGARIIREHYESYVREAVERGPSTVREQIAVAMDAIPADATGLDKWFEEHFQRPPISHDTKLRDHLLQAKVELKELFAEDAA